MPDIALKRSHQLGLKGARLAADKMADKLSEKFDLSGEWNGHILQFSRPGVNGQLAIFKAEMHLEVTLGFLLKAMKGPIEKAVHEQLEKVLAEARPMKLAATEKPASGTKPIEKKAVAKKK